MGEIVLRQLAEQGDAIEFVDVDSAGTGDWHIGERADRRTLAALAAGGHNNTLVLGAGLDLNGDLTLNAALLDAGAGGQALNLSGDWTSHGGAFAARASTVRFDGAQVQTIAGDVAFYDLAVGVGVSLTTASEVSAGGALTNVGWTVESKAIGGAGERAFGLAGVTVDVVTPGSLSALVVARRDQDHPQAHPTTATGRYWRITPTGSGYTAGLTLPHALSLLHI